MGPPFLSARQIFGSTTFFRGKKCIKQHFFVGKNVLFLYICMPFERAIEENSRYG